MKVFKRNSELVSKTTTYQRNIKQIQIVFLYIKSFRILKNQFAIKKNVFNAFTASYPLDLYPNIISSHSGKVFDM